MKNYNPRIHNRQSFRLKGYDYTQEGLYFVTICIRNRKCLFGEVINNEMQLNDAGKMAEKWYYKLEEKFPDIKCDTMIVMPNHFHCIIQNVGADPCVCPYQHTRPNQHSYPDHRIHPDIKPVDEPIRDDWEWGERGVYGGEHGMHGGELGMHGGEHMGDGETGGEHMGDGNREGEHMGSPLHRVIQWFKTMTTNEYIRGVKNLGWERFDGKLWQRNYWERIIRDERAYRNISNYIIANPSNWNVDKFKRN